MLLALGIPFLGGCEVAQGSAIIVGQRRPSTDPASIRIYADPPNKFETIALVHAQFEMGAMHEATKTEIALRELRKQAAAVGANGILLASVGSQIGVAGIYGRNVLVAGSVDMPELSGKAIWVTENSPNQ